MYNNIFTCEILQYAYENITCFSNPGIKKGIEIRYARTLEAFPWACRPLMQLRLTG